MNVKFKKIGFALISLAIVTLLMIFLSHNLNIRLNSQEENEPKTTIKMLDRNINLTKKDFPINACYLSTDEMKNIFWSFHLNISRSSVKFDAEQFMKTGIEIKELRKVNASDYDIKHYDDINTFYYSKYVTDTDDIVFIIFDDTYDPLQIIDYNDTLFSDSEKKKYQYSEMKKNMSLKKIIKDIDV